VKKNKKSVLALCALSILSTSCMDVSGVLHTKGSSKKSNKVTNDRATNRIIEDSGIKLQVISESALKEEALNKSFTSVNSPEFKRILDSLPQGEAAPSNIKSTQELKKQEESLLIGFPLSLIGEQSIFGGVITKVTDKENESLGTLKLTDLSPIHVQTVISSVQGFPVITLVGCFSNCKEDSEPMGLLNLPIVGFNQQTGMIIVDMSYIGKELDLITMLDPSGEYLKLKAISSDTVAVDFDLKNLIFDIKTRMIPLNADATDASVKTTDFTVRWYMKLGSGFNPAFTPRAAKSEVGFFKTERSAATKITRFSTTGDGTGIAPVKYYIKNVPTEFQKTFAKAMDSWNKEFKEIIGKELLTYEFVDPKDPINAELVAGDIRFNIIEWDLDNKAGYGGLGPSIANQYTGEIFSANVLVQGPTIVKLYTEWFGVSQKASALLAEGKTEEANTLIKEFEVAAAKEIDKRTKHTFKLKLGKHLEMNVHAQRVELEDPIKKGHFEIVPAGMTYEQYMEGYMVEILAHEIGHNLGLRHNFKGNLGAYEGNEPGSVSRSVMEYLGRPYRHLNIIGEYDRMAIAYGYTGKAPTQKDWFCTDEDQGLDANTIAVKSAECTKSDATNDPFSFWEGRLDRILELVLETNSAAAPVWKVEEVMSQIDETVTGLVAYGMSAEKTAHTWTNFFGKEGRPSNKSEVKAYVLERIKNKLCNPEINLVINSKESADAQKVARDNYAALLKAVEAKSAALKAYSAEELLCE
jgi:hypothetical protein